MTLVIACMVPLVIFAVITVVLVDKQQRASIERGLRDTARALSVAVDRQLIASISTLRALAVSEHLDTGDLERFRELAQRVLTTQPGWRTITLHSHTGRHLISAVRPRGSSFPSVVEPDVVLRARDAGEHEISDLFFAPVLKVPVVGVSVPVARDGVTRFVLGARLDLPSLTRLLADGKLPGDWIATIIDRSGTILARTRGIEQFLGTPATPGFVGPTRLSEEGSFRDVTTDGVAVYAAFNRSRLSGWTVGLGLPVATVSASGQRSLLAVIGGGVVLLLVAGVSAAAVGRRIARGIASLGTSASALGEGKIPSGTGQSGIAEVERVVREMAEAGRERAEAVAARLKTEEALRESEERTRFIVSHALDAVITIDSQGVITSWNPQAELLFGWRQDEAVGLRLSETVIPAAYREAHERGLAKFRATGEGSVLGRRIELPALRRDGTEFPIELAITPMPIGGEMAFSAFLRDITERKRTEQALRESEGSFRLLFADNPSPMWVYEQQTLACLEVNEAAVAAYGYSREEFLRMRISDLLPPEETARLAQVLAHPRALERRRTSEVRHRLRDGRVIEVLATSHVMDFAGRPSRLVVATDVTALKRAQASLARSTERLEILHEIDQALISGETLVVIAQTALLRMRDLLGVPRAIVSLFDLAAGEAEWLAAVGRRRVHLTPGFRFPLSVMGDVEALRRGELQVIDVAALPRSPETNAMLTAGVHTYMVVPMIASGELLGGLSFGGASTEFPSEHVGIAREVAAQLAIAVQQTRLGDRVRRHAEELEEQVRVRTLELTRGNEHLTQEIAERERAEQEADRANRLKSEFLANMSHELRTPLNGIIGFTELMHDGKLGPVTPDQHEFTGDILISAQHLLRLINDVLDLSKVESGKMEFRPEVIDLDAIASEVRDGLRAMAAQKRIAVVVEIDAGVKSVVSDASRMKQVLYNYVSNALKFTSDGGRVVVRAFPDGDETFRLEVEDSGIGIRPEDLGKLFIEFQQLDASLSKKHAGTGLGLALTRRIVEAQGGHVGVRSTAGTGSVFFAVLPRAVTTLLESRRPAMPRRAGGRPILIIDDDPKALKIADVTLRGLGFEPVCRSDGEGGLEALETDHPVAIVVDLLMPQMDGFDFLRRLRGSGLAADTPVIVWTAKDLTGPELDVLEEVVVVRKNEGVAALIDQLRAQIGKANLEIELVPTIGDPHDG